jgi:hypothetical protein
MDRNITHRAVEKAVLRSHSSLAASCPPRFIARFALGKVEVRGYLGIYGCSWTGPERFDRGVDPRVGGAIVTVPFPREGFVAAWQTRLFSFDRCCFV